MESTKNKLGELSGKISEAKNADTKNVKNVIKGSSEVITKLIESVSKLAGVTKDVNVVIGDAQSSSTAAVGADKISVETIINEVKAIIETAEKSGVNITKGTAGGKVNNTDGPKAVAHNAQATTGDANKLAAEVAKADPWAMIDKIKDAKTKTGAPADNDNAGQLATATASSANSTGTAATNADFAAAVALKAMTKGGKFSQPQTNEDGALKAAAASAVNKVLGVLDEIIRRTVAKNLDKVRDAVKEIKYSEITGEATEAAK